MYKFQLTQIEVPPQERPLLAGPEASSYWTLSHPRGWELTLGHDGSPGAPPEIFTGPDATLFTCLYPGRLASLDFRDGRIVAQVTLPNSPHVTWQSIDNLILAQGAQDFVAFSPEGTMSWMYGLMSPVAQWHKKRDALHITDLNGFNYALDLKTGRELDK